jgi:hypothetical protein
MRSNITFACSHLDAQHLLLTASALQLRRPAGWQAWQWMLVWMLACMPAWLHYGCLMPLPLPPPMLQVGDVLDRGDQELQILYYLERLQQEAEWAGGKLHVLNGNHETMNVMGYHRYATAGEPGTSCGRRDSTDAMLHSWGRWLCSRQ